MARPSSAKNTQAPPGEAEGANAPTSASRRLSVPTVLLVCLIAAALALRLWGIGWSLPNQQRTFTYHPDEGVNLMRGVMETTRDAESGQPVVSARPHLRLGFYNYGGLYFYLWQAAAAVNDSYGLVRQPAAGFAGRRTTDPVGALILVGRLLTALLGALTLWPIYALGRRLYGVAAGLVGAAVYAVLPAAVVHGHYATVDVTATFFAAMALAMSARLLPPGDGRRPWRAAALAGLCCGLAAAAKYNCGLVVLAPVAALLLQGGGARRLAPALSVVALGTLAGFVIGCPGALLEPDAFARDLAFEAGKSAQGMGLLFVDTGPGWLYHLRSSLRFGAGIPMLAAAIAGVGWAVARRRPSDLLLLAFLVPYYALIAVAPVRFLRYVIPLFPALAVLIGRLVADPPSGRKLVKAGVGATLAAAGIATLLMSLAMDHLMVMPDARDQAYAYATRNWKPGGSIALACSPWYWSPPFAPLFTANPRAARQAAASVSWYVFRLPAEGRTFDLSVLTPPPDHAVVSDLESEDEVRLRRPDAMAWLTVMRDGYAPTVFENHPTILGIDFGKPDYVPNDWLYTYPRITMYTRR